MSSSNEVISWPFLTVQRKLCRACGTMYHSCLCPQWLDVAKCSERNGERSTPYPTPGSLKASEGKKKKRDFMAREFLGQRWNICVQGGFDSGKKVMVQNRQGKKVAVKALRTVPKSYYSWMLGEGGRLQGHGTSCSHSRNSALSTQANLTEKSRLPGG